jgi:hypothetical protein
VINARLPVKAVSITDSLSTFVDLPEYTDVDLVRSIP